ncbi:MFS transporter, SP family, sugar:H+ symporter [Galdieria sulphuraria]|uniref:MFS transporter, SP family, sugar:H+ symporter n=1 Tax=Galdieria sulphuraria TaxID=130081 RepID=M2XBB0_GALSU|nr:MFS transporter, SP family, sugar:H+ symporter [Galdieria sulphuraria]EME27192.1 MFS transporter, SP family, sugar:H+ symporter [Galdieria sulphuraria]|eukprot:XP_005703712.1 MFS transporter, SP family, sugar:H+ symporter [Galdieria sulphuraria]
MDEMSFLSKLRGLPPKVHILLTVCTFGGSIAGIDTALVSGAQLFFVKRFHLDTSLQGLTVAATLLGALVGALLSNKLNKLVGRKGAMFLAGMDAIAAGITESCTDIWEVLLIGRLFLGICFGIMTSTIPMFLSECAPKHVRGMFTTVYQLAYAIGYFIGLIVDTIFVHVEHGWHFMLGSVTVPSLVVVCCLFFASESPRWLFMKGRQEDAWSSLLTLRSSQGAALEEYYEIREWMQREQEDTNSICGFFCLLYRQPHIRRPILLGIALQFAQQFCGVNAVMFYFEYVLQFAGLSDSHSIDVSLALGFAAVVFTFPAFWLVDRLGRRFLLLTTMPFVSLMLWLCGFSFFGGYKVRLVLNITGTLLFRLFYGPGLGPVPWIIVAEIYPWYVRSPCLTLNSFFCYLFNFTVSFSWPTMLKSMHAQGAFSFFASCTLLSTMFIYLFVPETKGLQLDSIERLFEQSFYMIAKENVRNTKERMKKWNICGLNHFCNSKCNNCTKQPSKTETNIE